MKLRKGKKLKDVFDAAKKFVDLKADSGKITVFSLNSAQKCSMDASIISEVERGGGVYNGTHQQKNPERAGSKKSRDEERFGKKGGKMLF